MIHRKHNLGNITVWVLSRYNGVFQQNSSNRDIPSLGDCNNDNGFTQLMGPPSGTFEIEVTIFKFQDYRITWQIVGYYDFLACCLLHFQCISLIGLPRHTTQQVLGWAHIKDNSSSWDHWPISAWKGVWVKTWIMRLWLMTIAGLIH